MSSTVLGPILRRAARRTAAASSRVGAAAPPLAARRSLHSVPPRSLHNVPARQDKPGSYSRTDSDIEVEYPEEHELPSSKPVRAGGQYVKPTLSSFSLDGGVGLVTGGARGLGLVIGQGMVYSGADLALVDMNSTFCASRIPSRSVWCAWADLTFLGRGGGRKTDPAPGGRVQEGKPGRGTVCQAPPLSASAWLARPSRPD